MSTEPTVDLAALRSCEAVCDSLSQAHRAYLLWLLAQQLGWHQARSQLPNGTYYRCLEVLRRAGLPVPNRHVTGDLTGQASHSPPLLPVLELMQLPGRQFRVTVDLDHEYPMGSLCCVETIRYGVEGWLVGMHPPGEPGSVTEISLTEFSTVTTPVEAPPQAAA